MEAGLTMVDRVAAAEALRFAAVPVCERVVSRMEREREEAVSSRWRSYCSKDCQFHLNYLAQAIESGRPELLGEYLAWARSMLVSYSVPEGDLVKQMQVIGEVLGDYLSGVHVGLARSVIDKAMVRISKVEGATVSSVPEAAHLSALATDYLSALLTGNRRAALMLILNAADDGVPIKSLYLNVFQPVQREIGRLWQYNKISVAQEHYCTAVTQHAMAQLYPRLFQGERNGRVVVAASVAGELHELGIRMVSDFFEMEGWDSFYLGANTPVAGIIAMIEEHDAHLLALSATITPHVTQVASIIEEVRSGCSHRVKIMVGGYPFNLSTGLWREVGADCYAKDAESAITEAERMVSGSSHD